MCFDAKLLGRVPASGSMILIESPQSASYFCGCLLCRKTAQIVTRKKNPLVGRVSLPSAFAINQHSIDRSGTFQQSLKDFQEGEIVVWVSRGSLADCSSLAIENDSNCILA